MLDLSIVTTCKSRLHHLQQTLPRMIATGAREVIVVDFNCPNGTANWVRQHHPEVRVIEVPGEPGFLHSRARNLGWAQATSTWVAFIDADVRLESGWGPWWAEHVPASSACWRHEQRPDRSRGTWGSCVVERRRVAQVNGYDEMLKGWGGEDDDFYHRLEGVGCSAGRIPADLMTPIDHGDEERVQHMPIGNKIRSFVVSRYYRTAKYQAMAFFRQRGELPLPARQQIDAQVRQALAPYAQGQTDHPASVTLTLADTEGMTSDWRLSKRCVITLGVEAANKDAVSSPAPATPMPQPKP